MNLTKKMTLALGLLVAGAGYAQTTATSSSASLLGQRYVEFGAGLQDIKHVSNHAYNVGARLNTALVPGALDGGVSYSYGWIGGPFRGHANTLFGYLNGYTTVGGVKPFAGAGLGLQRTSARFVGSDDQAIWGLNAGVEIPLNNALTLTPRIVYADDFEGSRNSSQEWTYEAEANYWVNAKTAVFGSIGKTDLRASNLDSWNYQVGFRLKF